MTLNPKPYFLTKGLNFQPYHPAPMPLALSPQILL